ncbi:hypothetical protein Tco_1476022 [Tanacetum coccineum]
MVSQVTEKCIHLLLQPIFVWDMAKPHSELSPRPHQWFWRKGIHMVHVSGGDEHVVALDFNGYLSALLYRMMDSEEFCGKERAHKRHSIQHKTVDMDLQQAYIGDQSIIIYSKYQSVIFYAACLPPENKDLASLTLKSQL